ncbi:MAG: hypothetical protein WBG92_08445 [Thiohalocapsa sp.]
MKITLAFAVLLLCAVLLLQWRDWPPGVPAPPTGTSSEITEPTSGETSAGSEILLPPQAIEDYASVAERPLFLPDRRPPPDDPEPEEDAMPEQLTELDGIDVTAVLISPSSVSAWVRRPNQRETTRLRLGDEFDGWTVEKIEPDRIVLERQGETDQLVLRDYQNAPAFTPSPPTPLVRRQRNGQQRGAPQSAPTDAGNRQAAPPAGRQATPRPAARRPKDEQ